MNTLIIEGEKQAANRLIKMLGKYDPSINVCDRLNTAKDSVKWLNKNTPPDMIFMDINLSDGQCFSIFEKIKVNSPIIFTTSSDEFALQAFKVNTIDYLLKPLHYSDLKSAMDKFFNWTKTLRAGFQDKPESNNSKSYRNRFAFKVGEQLIQVTVEDICYSKSIEKSTYLYCKNNKKIICDYTLGKLELMLDPASFFRVNRKYLIKKDTIQTIKKYRNSRLQLIIENFENEEIVVSRERVVEFKNWIEK